VVIPTCIMVRLNWVLPNGRQAVNVLHGSVAGGFTPTVAIANSILTAITAGGLWTALNAFLGTGTGLASVTLLDMRTPSNAPIDSTTGGGAGADAGTPLPPQTALVVTERTARAGPGFRGRFYVPGWTDAASTSTGEAVAGAVSALAAWSANFPAVFTAEAMTLGLAQPARAGYTGTTGTVHAARAAHIEPVTSLSVRNGIFDTQRRRAGRT
jgi:hypothetical protein